MRKLLQLGVFSLCLSTAFPALAQSLVSPNGIDVRFGVSASPVKLAFGRLATPGRPLVGPGSARRSDPIVIVDRVILGPTTEGIFHLSVYASGLVSVSRGSFPLDHEGDESATSEEVDFAFLDPDEVAALQQALFAAGASRLHGQVRRSGFLATFTRETQVTFFTPNRSLRPRALVANSFSFGNDVLDPTARRVEALLDDFVEEFFPGLS